MGYTSREEKRLIIQNLIKCEINFLSKSSVSFGKSI